MLARQSATGAGGPARREHAGRACIYGRGVGALLEPVGPLGAGTYWRRRLTVIAVLLVLLWLITRIGGDNESASAADGSETTVTTPGPTALEPAPDGASEPAGTDPSGGADAASPQSTSAPLVPPAAGPSSDAVPGAAGLPGAPMGEATEAPQGPQPCRPGELSLEAAASSPRYAEDARPELTVTVRTAGATPCTQDFGPRALGVVITSGQDRIWASRDCGAATSDVRVLTPGTPVVVPVTWNRVRSEPGCPAAAASAQPGTYIATPVAGDRTGQRASFLLE